MADKTGSSKLYIKGGAHVAVCPPAETANDITKNLSGVVVEQNKRSSFANITSLTQEFYLPNDYTRVDKTPDLTGAQVYLNATANSKVKYRIYRYDKSLNPRYLTSIDITNAISSDSGTKVTYTTITKHQLEVGDYVNIEGFTTTGFNGPFIITDVPSTTTFKVANTTSGNQSTTVAKIARPPRSSKYLKNNGVPYIKIGTLLDKDEISYKWKLINYDDLSSTAWWHGTFVYDKKIKIPKNSLLVRLDKRLKANNILYDELTVKNVHFKKNKMIINVYDINQRTKDEYQRIVYGQKGKKGIREGFKGYLHLKNQTKYIKGPFLDEYYSEIWAPITKRTITEIIHSNISFDEGEAYYKEPLAVDARYDSEVGWVGVVEGEATASTTGDQWLDIKFKPVEISDNWVGQKFKIVIEGAGINKIYYNTPSALPSNATAYKADNTALVSGATSSAMIRVLAAVANEGTDFLSNKFRSVVSNYNVEGLLAGDNDFWSSKPNPSKYGVESLYFDVSDATGDSAVVDAVYLDSASPGVNFNVYYSTDDNGPGTDTDSWNNLLWHHVPKTFKATTRQSYILPNPITAKYIKIEFSSLQAEYYNPGKNAKPIYYYKYPSWVVNYFLSIYDMQYNKTEDPFIAGQTNLRYDLLKLAFNYYRGDIINTTRAPVVIEDTNSQNNIVTNLLKNATVELQDYDLTSLTNIKASFDQFQKHPGYNARLDGVVGKAANLKSIEEYFNYSVERLSSARANTVDVSSTDRNHLLLEKSMPTMYFYPTCRHAYMEAYAKFENNKAYFVKIKEIRFERNNHTVISDQELYKFVPGDNKNYAYSDFTSSSDGWSVS